MKTKIGGMARVWFVAMLMATAFLGGCGGGGGGTTTTTPTGTAEGSWTGTLDTTRILSGLVLANGTYYLLYTTPDHLYIAGFIEGSGTSSSGTFSSSNAVDFNFENGGSISSALPLSTSYVANTSLSGTIAGTVPISTTYDPTYTNAPASLATIAGTYTGDLAVPTGALPNFPVTVSSTGSLSGSGSGCTLSGTLTPRTINAYDVSLTLTGATCAVAGSYTGVGDYSSTSSQLLFLAPNAARSNGLIFIGAATSTATVPPPTANALVGVVRGPVGAQVTLQNNLADNTSVTVASQTASIYGETSFAFPTVPAAGTPYSVSVFSSAANQTCSVYSGATGTIPVATPTTLKVGCEFTYDLLSRSSDNSAIAGTTTNNDVVIGGNATTGDGRYVAFISSAIGLTAANTNGMMQVFWRDRQTGKTLLVSANAAGVEGNNSSYSLAISSDGQTVAFESLASNLVTGDTNGVGDIFVWSAANPTAGVQRVSVGAGGAEANGASAHPTLSGDGTVVAFDTYANNLTTGVAGTVTNNIVRRDLTTGTNTLVSVGAGTTTEGNGSSGYPSLSEDGKRLAFWSYASNLVAGDANGVWDIFVYDATLGTNTLVSLTNTGAQQTAGGGAVSRIVIPTISGNGRYVAFSTMAALVPADTNGLQDVYVEDTQTPGTVVLASVTTAGALGTADSPYGQGARVALSFDGIWSAFSTTGSNLGTTNNAVVMHNSTTGETRIVANNGSSFVSFVSISRSAAYVAFGPTLTQYDPRFTNGGLFASYTGAANAWWWY